MRLCDHRWEAPRADVTDSLPVRHVCDREQDHDPPHHCVCGSMA